MKEGKSMELDTNRIIHIIITLSRNCNLRCNYCCYRPTQKEEEIKITTVKKFINAFLNGKILSNYKKDSYIEFLFLGGEPLLHLKKIKNIITYLERLDLFSEYKITTNGTLLSSEILDFFIKYKITPTISIDGNKSNHDKNRIFTNGKGSWEIIRKNLKKLIKQNIDFKLHITYHPNNNLAESVEYLLRYNKIITIYPLYEHINKGNIHKIKRDLILFKELYLNVFEKNKQMPIINLFDFFMRSHYEKLHGINNKYYCGVGNNVLNLDNNGTIYPCPIYAGYELNDLGNINNYNKKNHLFFNTLITKTPKLLPECKKCPANDICSLSFCPAKNAQYSKNSFIPLQGYCLFIREQKKVCVEIFEKLKKDSKFIERIKDVSKKYVLEHQLIY